MDLQQRRELNNGFGESLARAFELVTTPLIMGFIGFLVDGKAGTRPLFMLLFAFITFVYLAWKMWGSYERRMQEHEAQLPGARLPGRPNGAKRV